jgi:hypothetical protein
LYFVYCTLIDRPYADDGGYEPGKTCGNQESHYQAAAQIQLEELTHQSVDKFHRVFLRVLLLHGAD